MVIDALGPDEARAALKQVDHIVVVMMENRSFDHMLGYLRLAGREDVDGLRPEFKNQYKGKDYPVHHLERRKLEHWEDPNHSGKEVDNQIKDQNQGFARSYIDTRPPEYREQVKNNTHVLPMGYYDAGDVPTYDHLADNFCVCDRWFSSTPGATWPNRLYSMCGQSQGRRDNKKLFGKFDFPVHFIPSFVRLLDDRNVNWRWYHAHPGDLEPPTLQLADARYFFRPGQHFALFDQTEAGGQQSFLEDAAAGELAPVSWIDPDFGVHKLDIANDDHPPGDIRHGQAFIRTVCNAIMEGPLWDKTLLAITYDEHGGFYDHVHPLPAADDDEDMRRYGVRVPAIVVSPFVEAQAVSGSTFDHTSIIKTVLERFCVKDDGTLPWIGARVAAANHLGVLLRTKGRSKVPVPELEFAGEEDGAAPVEVTVDHQVRLAAPRPASLSAETVVHAYGGPEPVNDLQLGLLRAGLERRTSVPRPE